MRTPPGKPRFGNSETGLSRWRLLRDRDLAGESADIADDRLRTREAQRRQIGILPGILVRNFPQSCIKDDESCDANRRNDKGYDLSAKSISGVGAVRRSYG